MCMWHGQRIVLHKAVSLWKAQVLFLLPCNPATCMAFLHTRHAHAHRWLLPGLYVPSRRLAPSTGGGSDSGRCSRPGPISPAGKCHCAASSVKQAKPWLMVSLATRHGCDFARWVGYLLTLRSTSAGTTAIWQSALQSIACWHRRALASTLRGSGLTLHVMPRIRRISWETMPR